MEEKTKEQDYQIFNLKFTHSHFQSGLLVSGMPLKTTIELKYNYKKGQWEKIVTHVFLHKNSTNLNTFEVKIDDNEKVDAFMKDLDLTNLKNNYFTNKCPTCFTHWEIEYNNRFKVVGTYDKQVELVSKIKDFVEFEKYEAKFIK